MGKQKGLIVSSPIRRPTAAEGIKFAEVQQHIDTTLQFGSVAEKLSMLSLVAAHAPEMLQQIKGDEMLLWFSHDFRDLSQIVLEMELGGNWEGVPNCC